MKWGILSTGNIAKKFAREHDIPRYYDSYKALVNDPDVDAVYVATPNTLHYEERKGCGIRI